MLYKLFSEVFLCRLVHRGKGHSERSHAKTHHVHGFLNRNRVDIAEQSVYKADILKLQLARLFDIALEKFLAYVVRFAR